MTDRWGDHEAANIDYEPEPGAVLYAEVWVDGAPVGVIWTAPARPRGTLRAGALQWTQDTPPDLSAIQMALLNASTMPEFDAEDAIAYWSEGWSAGKGFQVGTVQKSSTLGALREQARRHRLGLD